MARAVKISRSAGGTAAPDDPDGGARGYRPNRSALTRSMRLFLVFVLAVAIFFVAFLGLLARSTDPSAPVFGESVGLLAGFAVAMVVVAFALTLGRTPRGLEHGGDRLVVVEYLGRRRIFPLDGSFRPIVENRYPGGALAPEPTEMVAFASARGPVRHYLLDRELVPERAR